MSGESPILRLFDRLEGVKSRNGGFIARCPAHNDHEPSLSFRQGDDGRVLLKCFAGCAFKDIVAAMGLEEKDLFPDNLGVEGVYPRKSGATLQHPPKKPHSNADKLLQPPNATVCNTATPRNGEDGYPHLRVVGGSEAQDCTLDAYAEYVGLPVDFLRGLGLREIHYIDQKAVKTHISMRRATRSSASGSESP